MIQDCAAQVGRRIITVEYEIVLYLFERVEATSSELAAFSSTSDGTLFTALKRLEAANVICSSPSNVDGRVRINRLSDWARRILEYEYLTFYRHREPEGTSDRDRLARLSDTLERMRLELKFRFFTAEYQILLCLYFIRGAAPSGHVKGICDTSPTKFFSALKFLTTKKFVCATVDPSDRRIHLYGLSDHARQMMGDVQGRVANWVEVQAGKSQVG